MARKNAWQGGFAATLYQWWLTANYASDLFVSGGVGMSHTQMDMGLALLQRIPGAPAVLGPRIFMWAQDAVHKIQDAPPHQHALAYIRLTRAYLDTDEKRKAINTLESIIWNFLSDLRTNTDRSNQQQLASILVHMGRLCEQIGGMHAYASNSLYEEAISVAETCGATSLRKKAKRLLERRQRATH